MPSVYQIKFLPGGESRKFYGSDGDSYVLEDDTLIDVLSCPYGATCAMTSARAR
jgi:hypothetical protein